MSIAQQLGQLRAEEQYTRLQASVLFSRREADAQPLQDVAQLAMRGCEQLRRLDPRFDEFQDALFHGRVVDPSVLDANARAQISSHVRRFCLVLTPFFVLRPAQKCIEWLVRGYRAEEHPKDIDSLLMCGIPFHGTEQFRRLAQALLLRRKREAKAGAQVHKWDFLLPAVFGPDTAVPRKLVSLAAPQSVLHSISRCAFLCAKNGIHAKALFQLFSACAIDVVLDASSANANAVPDVSERLVHAVRGVVEGLARINLQSDESSTEYVCACIMVIGSAAVHCSSRSVHDIILDQEYFVSSARSVVAMLRLLGDPSKLSGQISQNAVVALQNCLCILLTVIDFQARATASDAGAAEDSPIRNSLDVLCADLYGFEFLFEILTALKPTLSLHIYVALLNRVLHEHRRVHEVDISWLARLVRTAPDAHVSHLVYQALCALREVYVLESEHRQGTDSVHRIKYVETAVASILASASGSPQRAADFDDGVVTFASGKHAEKDTSSWDRVAEFVVKNNPHRDDIAREQLTSLAAGGGDGARLITKVTDRINDPDKAVRIAAIKQLVSLHLSSQSAAVEIGAQNGKVAHQDARTNQFLSDAVLKSLQNRLRTEHDADVVLAIASGCGNVAKWRGVLDPSDVLDRFEPWVLDLTFFQRFIVLENQQYVTMAQCLVDIARENEASELGARAAAILCLILFRVLDKRTQRSSRAILDLVAAPGAETAASFWMSSLLFPLQKKMETYRAELKKKFRNNAKSGGKPMNSKTQRREFGEEFRRGLVETLAQGILAKESTPGPRTSKKKVTHPMDMVIRYVLTDWHSVSTCAWAWELVLCVKAKSGAAADTLVVADLYVPCLQNINRCLRRASPAVRKQMRRRLDSVLGDPGSSAARTMASDLLLSTLKEIPSANAASLILSGADLIERLWAASPPTHGAIESIQDFLLNSVRCGSVFPLKVLVSGAKDISHTVKILDSVLWDSHAPPEKSFYLICQRAKVSLLTIADDTHNAPFAVWDTLISDYIALTSYVDLNSGSGPSPSPVFTELLSRETEGKDSAGLLMARRQVMLALASSSTTSKLDDAVHAEFRQCAEYFATLLKEELLTDGLKWKKIGLLRALMKANIRISGKQKAWHGHFQSVAEAILNHFVAPVSAGPIQDSGLERHKPAGRQGPVDSELVMAALDTLTCLRGPVIDSEKDPRVVLLLMPTCEHAVRQASMRSLAACFELCTEKWKEILFSHFLMVLPSGNKGLDFESTGENGHPPAGALSFEGAIDPLLRLKAIDASLICRILARAHEVQRPSAHGPSVSKKSRRTSTDTTTGTLTDADRPLSLADHTRAAQQALAVLELLQHSTFIARIALPERVMESVLACLNALMASTDDVDEGKGRGPVVSLFPDVAYVRNLAVNTVLLLTTDVLPGSSFEPDGCRAMFASRFPSDIRCVPTTTFALTLARIVSNSAQHFKWSHVEACLPLWSSLLQKHALAKDAHTYSVEIVDSFAAIIQSALGAQGEGDSTALRQRCGMTWSMLVRSWDVAPAIPVSRDVELCSKIFKAIGVPSSSEHAILEPFVSALREAKVTSGWSMSACLNLFTAVVHASFELVDVQLALMRSYFATLNDYTAGAVDDDLAFGVDLLSHLVCSEEFLSRIAAKSMVLDVQEEMNQLATTCMSLCLSVRKPRTGADLYGFEEGFLAERLFRFVDALILSVPFEACVSILADPFLSSSSKCKVELRILGTRLLCDRLEACEKLGELAVPRSRETVGRVVDGVLACIDAAAVKDRNADGMKDLELAGVVALQRVATICAKREPAPFIACVPPLLKLLQETQKEALRSDVAVSVLLCFATLVRHVGASTARFIPLFVARIASLLAVGESLASIKLVEPSMFEGIVQALRMIAEKQGRYFGGAAFIDLVKYLCVTGDTAKLLRFFGTHVPFRVLLPALQACLEAALDVQNSSQYHQPLFTSTLGSIDVMVGALDKHEFEVARLDVQNMLLSLAEYNETSGCHWHLRSTCYNRLVDGLLKLCLRLSEAQFDRLFKAFEVWSTSAPSKTETRRNLLLRWLLKLQETLLELAVPYAERSVGMMLDALTAANHGHHADDVVGAEDESEKKKKSQSKKRARASGDHNTPTDLDERDAIVSSSKDLAIDNVSVWMNHTRTYVGDDAFEQLFRAISAYHVHVVVRHEEPEPRRERVYESLAWLAKNSLLAANPDDGRKRLVRVALHALEPLSSSFSFDSEAAAATDAAARVRRQLAALACSERVAIKLGKEYLTVLPEIIPLLADGLDNEEEAVEHAVRTFIAQLELHLGESILSMIVN
ncbi:HEAT repeat-containing protein 1 [Porphyridium purpureum]|uniref:HEAT repeat-containing protein 1 n=1 Tax=Porphyridium purpureum TaxID=35688 RepID=A0A5J4YJ63_PORPP|nr:HEAT repeat-containing protein 1 [Porphyridium purpureum]|eukprot:POR6039..scf261_15